MRSVIKGLHCYSLFLWPEVESPFLCIIFILFLHFVPITFNQDNVTNSKSLGKTFISKTCKYGWSIEYIEGSQVIPSKNIAFPSLKVSTVQTLMQCLIWWHFIWVCTVCQSTHLGVSSLERVTDAIHFLSLTSSNSKVLWLEANTVECKWSYVLISFWVTVTLRPQLVPISISFTRDREIA